VLLCVLESIFVLLEALGVLELELGVELVLGALEPPAALASLSVFDFDFEVEPLEDWSLSFLFLFLFLLSPLCLPLFMWVRPWASVDTFGLSVGPAFGVSDVVAPAPAFVPVEALPLMPLLVLVPAPTFTSALPLAFVSPCTLVLWAAASWLNDTASKLEKRTGKNLRIEDPPGLGNEIQGILLQTPCHRGAYFGGSTGSSRGSFCGLGVFL